MEKIKVILFDLDGTLLPMDNDYFTEEYFKLLIKKMSGYGYEPKKLIENVWTGTAAMVKNDGKITNEEAFWKTFTALYGPSSVEDIPIFEEFYREEFQEAKRFCGFASLAKTVVEQAREKGCRVVLATNPLFPAVATESRIRWAGFEPEDFELYTTYENIGYCKPNLEYYKELTRRLRCEPQECLMVGNDVDEDLIAENIGMQVFLLSDHIINRKNRDITKYPQGDFEALAEYIQMQV